MNVGGDLGFAISDAAGAIIRAPSSTPSGVRTRRSTWSSREALSRFAGSGMIRCVEATWDEVRSRRLARSFLSERASGDRLVEVVSALCGVQAQLQNAAELQLGARVDGVTQADIRAAVWEQRVFAKAWTLRGTLHLHPAGELPLWHAAQRAAQGPAREGLPAWRDPARTLHPALGADEVDAVRAVIWEALDGRILTRDELTEAIANQVGDGAQARLRSGFAFFNSDLCQGPPQGARITLVRPDQWIGGWRQVDEREALREVCRRFLRTYGPARPADFAVWFGAAQPQAVFDELGDELEEIDVAGRRSFVLAGDRSFPTTSPQVRLLPEYDVYVLGSRERDELIPEPVRRLIASHRRGQYEGPAATRIVLVDGIAAGLWERRKRGRRIELQVRLVRRLGKAAGAELRREVERIGAFLGLEAAVSVDVG